MVDTGGHDAVNYGTWYIFNNTFQCGMDSVMGACSIGDAGNGSGGVPADGTMVLTLSNNHWISTNTSSLCCSGSLGSGSIGSCYHFTCSEANAVYQTLSVANGQGYNDTTSAFAFQPTSALGSTVGTGTNENSALCTAINAVNTVAGAACAKGTGYACKYNTTNHTISCPALTEIARPPTAAWDKGAYEYSSALTPNIVVPSSVAFGNQEVNTTSNYQTVEIQNTGTAPLVVSSFALTGPFAITYPSIANVCTAPSFNLPTGSFCYIGVTFSPTVVGAVSGSLTIVSNAPSSPTVISLSGTGTQPILSWTPTAYSFGTVTTNTSTNSTAITLANSASATATANVSITITGTGFSQTNTCGTTLTAGSNCTFTVEFNPSTPGNFTGTLTETDFIAGITLNLPLSGTAVNPAQTVITAPWPVVF